MIDKKIIKVCGMREAANIQKVETLEGVDIMGFIFYPPSPRYVYEAPSYLPVRVRRAGVFVNADEASIVAYAERFKLDYVQLHGEESPALCHRLRTIGLKVIKAFPIARPEDIGRTHPYEDACDYFLFDTKCKQYGGSGKRFDWEILHGYKENIPFLLSGGVGIEDMETLKGFRHPQLAGYDLNSRFETYPGEKDVERLRTFLSHLSSDSPQKEHQPL